MEFRDRVANKPNRVRLTYEEGGSSVYATVELADEPIDEGTPLNALNMNKLLNKENNDYIIEQGTSGGFTWEKWNSGTIKMWCKTTTSYVNEYITMATISYPTGITLIEWGCAFVTINDGFNHTGFGLDINAKAVAKETLAGVFVHKYSGGLTEDNSNIPVSLFIIGRWK